MHFAAQKVQQPPLRGLGGPPQVSLIFHNADVTLQENTPYSSESVASPAACAGGGALVPDTCVHTLGGWMGLGTVGFRQPSLQQKEVPTQIC